MKAKSLLARVWRRATSDHHEGTKPTKENPTVWAEDARRYALTWRRLRRLGDLCETAIDKTSVW